MAQNAFDDQYVECVDQMERIAPKLLEEVMHMNKKFKAHWENAKKHWKQIKNKISYSSKLNDFHGTALVAYTGNITHDFNTAVRIFHLNQHNFYFKDFHYYLTRALQLLDSGSCYTVYRGSEAKFTYRGKENVRFGQFASSSLDRIIAMNKFHGKSGTLFITNTCMGVNITDFSLHHREKEVLIPGCEVYQKVTNNKKPQDKYNTIEQRESKTMNSKYNCFYENYDSNFNRAGRRKPCIPVLLPGILLLLLLFPIEL